MQLRNTKTASLPTVSFAQFLRLFPIQVFDRAFLQNVSLLTFANIFAAAASVSQGVLVARWLQPELYGLAALVISYPSLLYSLFDTRSVEASVKYLGEFYSQNDRDRLLAVCKLGYILDFGAALVTFIVVLLTAGWAASNIAHRADVAGFIILSAASFVPYGFVGTSHAILSTLGRFTLIGWLGIFTSSFRLALVSGLVFAGLEVKGVVWGNAVAMVLTGFLQASIAWVLIYRSCGASPLQGRWQALKGRRREILRFITYSDLNALITIIPRELDLVVLGHFRGPLEVGYYKLAKSFASITGSLSTPLQAVVYPELAKLWAVGDKESFHRRVRALALLGAPAGLATLIAMMLVPFVVPVLVGSAFRNAVPATQVLLVASALGLAFFWMRPFFLAQGQFRQWFLSSGFVIILFTFAYPFLVLPFGHMGAALWYLTIHVCGFGVALFFVKRSI